MTRFIKLGAKLGLVGGSIYYTNEIGVWKDSSSTEGIYKEAYSFVAPYVKDVPVEIPELPKVDDLSATSKNLWNHGIIAVAQFLTEIPKYIVSLSMKGGTMVMSLFENSENPKPTSE